MELICLKLKPWFIEVSTPFHVAAMKALCVLLLSSCVVLAEELPDLPRHEIPSDNVEGVPQISPRSSDTTGETPLSANPTSEEGRELWRKAAATARQVLSVALDKEGTYQENPTRADREGSRYDCTTWVTDVLADAGLDVGRSTSDQINLVDVSQNDIRRDLGVLAKKTAGSLLSGDQEAYAALRSTGVYGALITSGQGLPIDFSSVRSGDVVQYWDEKGDSMVGHSGIIKDVLGNGRVVLRGAHRSMGKVGDLTVNLKNRTAAFVVRPLKR